MDRRLENAQCVADQIMAPGGKGIAVEADVTNKASLDAMVEQTLKVFGHLDILVNNVGVALRVEIGIIQKSRSKNPLFRIALVVRTGFKPATISKELYSQDDSSITIAVTEQGGKT